MQLKPPISANVLLCLLSVTLLINACQSTNNTAKTPEGTETEAAQNTPAIYLDTLSILGKDFKKVIRSTDYKNIIFTFSFKKNSVRLRGWVNKKTKTEPNDPDTIQFNPKPDLYLTPRGASKIAVDTDSTYLNSQILYKKDVKNILDGLKNSSVDENVVIYFVPKKDSTGRVFYSIGFSKKTRIHISDYDFNFDTNPSPPHKSYD